MTKALSDFDLDNLILSANLIANESCPPGLLDWERLFAKQHMGMTYLEYASGEIKYEDLREFILMLFAFLITMPKELSCEN